MEYVTTEVRFGFFNGKDKYTVEYCYGLCKWFIFHNEERTGCVYQKEDKKPHIKYINRGAAEDILYEYLETIN